MNLLLNHEENLELVFFFSESEGDLDFFCVFFWPEEDLDLWGLTCSFSLKVLKLSLHLSLCTSLSLYIYLSLCVCLSPSQSRGYVTS